MSTIVDHVAACPLPSTDAWRAAAAFHEELFAPLDRGVRIALVSRAAPTHMLVWQVGDAGVDAHVEPFAGYGASGAEIALAADDEYLVKIGGASDRELFFVLRSGIRSGHVVCYTLERRCVLEERGFDDLLDALGFAFMGACR